MCPRKFKPYLPQDCIISEKSLATAGGIRNAKVITGKATAPPPKKNIRLFQLISAEFS